MSDFHSLKTSRLVLRRFATADLDGFLAYRNDPQVARYQLWDPVTPSAAQVFIQQQQEIAPGTPGEWFQLAIEEQHSGLLVGDVGLKVDGGEPRQAELGISLAPVFQGRGLAFEAASCVLDFAFVRLGLHRVVGITDAENFASAALLRHLGMRCEGHFIQNIWFKGKWGDELWFAILRDEWLQRNQEEKQ